MDETKTEAMGETKKEALDETKKEALDETKKEDLDETKKEDLDEMRTEEETRTGTVNGKGTETGIVPGTMIVIDERARKKRRIKRSEARKPMQSYHLP